METKQVSLNQLSNILATVPSNTKAKMTSVTEPKLKKTGNPYAEGSVSKKSTSEVLLNYSYEVEVNRGRISEGKEYDFKAKPRAWGERFNNTPLIIHNGQLYLDCKFISTEPSTYLHEGKVIDKELLKEWLPSSKPSASSQGLNEENAVIVRTFKIASIVEIEFDNVLYIVK